MKSKTSFFNASVLRKDLTRFLPVWGLYTLGLILLYVLSLSSDPVYIRTENLLSYLMPSMAIPAMLYAGVCAAVLFGDLYVPKLCYALHSMPMRREGWFVTHCAAGILFSLIPHLVTAAVLLVLLGEYGYVVGIWLAVVTLQNLFFFGLAVFCVMCAGNRLGMVATYLIFNFLSMFVYALVQTFYMPLLYGVVLKIKPFQILCPVYSMAANPPMVTRVDSWAEQLVSVQPDPTGWSYLLILALIGVGLAFSALLLYRRRDLERAGDFVAVRPMAPFFLLMSSLASGMVLYLVAEIFDNRLPMPFLFIGMAVGFFVGQMLLQKTSRVFRLRSVVHFGVLAAVMGLSLFVVKLDPLGVVRWLPAEDQIVSCHFGGDYDWQERTITDSKEIHQIVQFHEFLSGNSKLETGEDEYYNSIRVRLSYELADGRTVEREYIDDDRTETGKEIIRYLHRWQTLLKTDDLKAFGQRVAVAYFNIWESDAFVEIPLSAIPELLEAFAADCDEGHMIQNPYKMEESNCTLEFHLRLDDGSRDAFRVEYIDISQDAVHTLQVLEKYRNP